MVRRQTIDKVTRQMVKYQMAFFVAAIHFVVFACLPVAVSAEAVPRWEFVKEKETLFYGWPDSDIIPFLILCRGGNAHVDILIRPPDGKPGDKTAIIFRNGTRLVHHTATLTELDGLSGDDVEFSIPTSDKLFDLLMRDGPVFGEVPGAMRTLPAQNGRARETKKFLTSCVSP
jgi:hypothetical protein